MVKRANSKLRRIPINKEKNRAAKGFPKIILKSAKQNAAEIIKPSIAIFTTPERSEKLAALAPRKYGVNNLRIWAKKAKENIEPNKSKLDFLFF